MGIRLNAADSLLRRARSLQWRRRSGRAAVHEVCRAAEVDAVLDGNALDVGGLLGFFGGSVVGGSERQDTVSVHVGRRVGILATATQAEPQVAMGADILGQVCNPIYLLSFFIHSLNLIY